MESRSHADSADVIDNTTAAVIIASGKISSQPRSQGFTLVELLMVVAIIGILLSSGLTHYQELLARNQATVVVNWLISTIHFARYNAAKKNITVTLCALEGESCTRNWHQGLNLFADNNQNGKLDSHEKLIASLKPAAPAGSILWRSFGNKPYLQFTSMGYTNFQNGNITYCPKDPDSRFRRQIVITVQGRPRLVHTRNLAGQPIDRQGRILRC
jgi:prepilin-type N-terminal cleavage/methylation domain-containing protein